MKIIIESEGVKRELVGSFSMCLGRPDLERLIDQLNDALKRADRNCTPSFVYGWIEIHEPLPSTPNQKPIGWSDVSTNPNMEPETSPDPLREAAPDLLKACIRALDFVSDEHNNEIIIKEEMPGSFGLWSDLADAIGKARGERPQWKKKEVKKDG